MHKVQFLDALNSQEICRINFSDPYKDCSGLKLSYYSPGLNIFYHFYNNLPNSHIVIFVFRKLSYNYNGL
jgi:hypothetical protein